MVYGYCRSANDNKKSIEQQIEWVKIKGVKEENIYKDTGSGLNTNRVELNKLLDSVKEGDTILAKDINRITRNSKGLEDILGNHVIDGINGVDAGTEGVAAVLSTSIDMLREFEDSLVDIDDIEE